MVKMQQTNMTFTSCFHCRIGVDLSVESVAHSSVSYGHLEIFVTARHPFPTTTTETEEHIWRR